MDHVSASQKVTLRIVDQVSLAVSGNLPWLILTDGTTQAPHPHLEGSGLSDWWESNKAGKTLEICFSLYGANAKRESAIQRESFSRCLGCSQFKPIAESSP